MNPVKVAGLAVLVLFAAPAMAGELLLANGSRVAGELAGDVLMVSTGADLIEVSAEEVGVLTPAEIQLKDGRVIKGSVVGGRLTARTPLGELSIDTAELRAFRAEGFARTSAPGSMPVASARVAPEVAPAPPPAPATPVPAASAAVAPTPASPAPPPADPAGPPASAATPPAPEATEAARAPGNGLPPVSLYQPPPAAEAVSPRPAPALHAAVTTPALPPPTNGRRGILEVIVAEGVLRPNAVHGGQPVGKVQRGERLTYLDSVDRRLRVFNALVFDGGHWVKVRAEDGTVGWLPASTVRDVR
jgi:hypothetical protein